MGGNNSQRGQGQVAVSVASSTGSAAGARDEWDAIWGGELAAEGTNGGGAVGRRGRRKKRVGTGAGVGGGWDGVPDS